MIQRGYGAGIIAMLAREFDTIIRQVLRLHATGAVRRTTRDALANAEDLIGAVASEMAVDGDVTEHAKTLAAMRAQIDATERLLARPSAGSPST